MLNLYQKSFLALLSFGVACSSCDNVDDSDSSGDSSAEVTDESGDGSSDTIDVLDEAPTDLSEACTAESTKIGQVACVANEFLNGLDDSSRATASYTFDDSVNRTCWTNFPGPAVGSPRPGITMGQLSEESQSLVFTLASLVLSEEGYSEFVGILAADNYLGSIGDGSIFGSQYFKTAVFGTPSADGTWMLMLGTHHYAVLTTFVDGVAYPVPYHLAVEPRAAFTYNGTTYQPMAEAASAFGNMMAALTADQLTDAQLAGTVNNLLLGPVEFCTGSTDDVVYPVQEGILVSSLSADQQALVTEAIRAWVGDFASDFSSSMISDYTSAEAYAQTYVGYANSIEPGASNAYIRIDGPRLWIEFSTQDGRDTDETHYHTMFRDKSFDYGASL